VGHADPLVCIAFCERIALAVVVCASSHCLVLLALNTHGMWCARAVGGGSVDNADPMVVGASRELGALAVGSLVDKTHGRDRVA
jgi:hypothetical protein